jgi:hypothetical protein
VIYFFLNNITIEDFLTSMYYDYGREILCDILFKPERYIIKQLREECFFKFKKNSVYI